MRRPGLIGGVTQRLERAVRAARRTRDADLPAVVDQLMREGDPTVLRNELHQVMLDLLRLVVDRKLKPAREAQDMRVDDHADGDLIPAPAHDVGRLAGDAGKLEQLFHGLRDLVAEALDDGFGGALDGLGLIAEEAGGADQRFELGQGSGGHVLRAGIGAEERGCDQIDAGVGALRGEDGGDRELPGAGVV